MHAYPLALILLVAMVALVGWRYWRGMSKTLPKPARQPANLTPEAAIAKLTSLSPAGRDRLTKLLALEKQIAADAVNGAITVAQLAAYLQGLAEAGEDITHHIIGSTITVKQGAFEGDITAGEGNDWLLTGRGRDRGQDHNFTSTEELIWGGLTVTGRPTAYIQSLYAKEA